MTVRGNQSAKERIQGHVGRPQERRESLKEARGSK